MAGQIHATCVDLDGFGVLLRGASGGGKSDLALRLIDRGARLVADDRVEIAAVDGALVARPPAALVEAGLAGAIEVRGLGIVRVEAVARTVLGLVADLMERSQIPRLPAPETCRLLDIEIARLRLDPFAASAAAKLRLAARAARRDILITP